MLCGVRNFVAMALVLFVVSGMAVMGQTIQNCPLVISSVTGDVTAFTVVNFDATTLSLASAPITVGSWGTLVVGSSVNANVVVGVVQVGTKNAVFVTASKVDPNLAASFTLVATDSVGHSVTVNAIADCPIVSRGCTLTQGFWKNHAEDWPVQSLTLGTVNYTKTQLLTVLRTPVRGNGLISLSHQLIAAKLNASGATVPSSVATAIAAADALIGGLVVPPIGGGSLSTSSTSSLTSALDTYNNGNTPGGPPHCD